MLNLYIPIGISGSGKTRLRATLQLQEPLISVCPDDIRKELTGSVSDQSKNGLVFSLAFGRTQQLLIKGRSVYFDATNLQRKSVRTLLEIAHETGATPRIYILKDSEDANLCRTRVQKDLSSGIDRSDTSDLLLKIQEKQQKAYYNILPYIESLKPGVEVLFL